VSDVALPTRTADPRERLRLSFLGQARGEIDELVALLEEGGSDEREHVRHALLQMADRALSLGLVKVEDVARGAAVSVAAGSPPKALRAVAEALAGPERRPLFAPIAVVTGGRRDLLGGLDVPVCESLRVVTTVEELVGEVWFDDVHAALAPVKPRRELLRLAAAAPRRTYAWGPGDDVPKRLTALTDGAVGYFGVPLDLPAVLERIRFDTWRRVSPPPRVHLVAGADLLGDALEAALSQEGIAVARAGTTAEALHGVRASCPELIVTTGTLDSGDLRNAVATLRADEGAASVPVVLIGEERDHGLAVGTVDATLPADLAPVEIARAVRRRLDRPTGRVPWRDPLTGLPIRPAVLARLDEELARSLRARTPVTVALVALDAVAGPPGDRALRRAAEVLRAGVRRYDLVGRLAESAFLVVLPGCVAPIAVRRLSEMRVVLEDRIAAEGVPERPFVAGVADTTRDVANLLARADAALAQAHASGAVEAR